MSFGLKANIKAPHKFLRMGSVCWMELPNNGWANERFSAWAITRGGRKVITWVNAVDLENYRPGWIHKDDGNRHSFGAREEAQVIADYMNTEYGDKPVRIHAAEFSKK